VAVNSTMVPLGATAPEFALPDPAGRVHALHGMIPAPALLVMFLCNHCPYVQHIRSALAQRTLEWQQKGVAVVGIQSNDWSAYPDDSPERMAEEIRGAGYAFPYLIDETQEVAKAYGAACTPDFFLFDASQRLVYRGRFDESRPGGDAPVTGADLERAVAAVIAEERVPGEQFPSIGCSIKWRPGNEPDAA
jgi:peroxiredoxin